MPTEWYAVMVEPPCIDGVTFRTPYGRDRKP